MADQVTVFDAWNQDITRTIDPWDTWEKILQKKGFPGGLITFLQTSSDFEGCGFPTPTTIQAYAWPILQNGQDLVGIAKTGSGKTLAFLLPGFIKLRRMKRKGEIDTSRGPALLALTPTRELCYQIFSDTEKFGKPVEITAACAYGGAPKRDQEWKFKQGPDCVIATPGRLNDFINNGSIFMDQVHYAVLDEADRMLDMGFEPQIRQIMERVPRNRQTAMFTATWPRECVKLAESYVKDPQRVQIGGDDITTNTDIRQHIEVCQNEQDKMNNLRRILGYLKNGNCLIFSNTKKKCRDLGWELNRDRRLNLHAVELHGDLDQRQRDESLNKFRRGEARILVATDVAARGLDIRNITMVINYEAPNNCAEDYVHRIGRTGRAGDTGDAYTFLMSWGEDKKAAAILNVMEKANQPVPQALKSLCGIRSTPAPLARREIQANGSGNRDNGNTWERNTGSSPSWRKGGSAATPSAPLTQRGPPKAPPKAPGKVGAYAIPTRSAGTAQVPSRYGRSAPPASQEPDLEEEEEEEDLRNFGAAPPLASAKARGPSRAPWPAPSAASINEEQMEDDILPEDELLENDAAEEGAEEWDQEQYQEQEQEQFQEQEEYFEEDPDAPVEGEIEDNNSSYGLPSRKREAPDDFGSGGPSKRISLADGSDSLDAWSLIGRS